MSVALRNELALRLRQVQRGAVIVVFGVRNGPQEGIVHLAIQLREAGIGADRLFDLKLGDGAN